MFKISFTGWFIYSIIYTICRPDFTRTTKKRKSAIGSIEYTIKRNCNGKIRNKKSRRKSGLNLTKITSLTWSPLLISCSMRSGHMRVILMSWIYNDMINTCFGQSTLITFSYFCNHHFHWLVHVTQGFLRSLTPRRSSSHYM